MSIPPKSLEEEDFSKAVEGFRIAFLKAKQSVSDLESAAEELQEEASHFVGEAPHHSISDNLLNNLCRWYDAYHAWELSRDADVSEQERLCRAVDDAANIMFNEGWELFRKPRQG